MGSKTIKTEGIRARKHAPNKANLKTDEKRLRKNLEVIATVEKSVKKK